MVQHQYQVAAEDVRWLRALAEDRSKLYWLLSGFFLDPPTVDSLQALHSQLSGGTREPLDAANPLLAELQAILEAASDLDRLATELGVEYTRLFHGLKEGVGLPPPYESVHRESRLMGAATAAVAGAYADAGYGEIHAPAGPQDHLGVELRFLSLLCFDESRFWDGDNFSAAHSSWSRQWNFLTRHVLAWIPAYCDALERVSAVDYYRTIAGLTRNGLQHDHQVLLELREQFGLN